MITDYEVYELIFRHYTCQNEYYHRQPAEEPLAIKVAFDRRFTPPSVCLDEMFEKMKEAILEQDNKIS